MEVKDTLLTEHIKIPVRDKAESVIVQKALFEIGCGFHSGTKLEPNLETDWDVLAVCVTPMGTMTCYVRDHDEASYANCKYIEIKPSELLNADLSGLDECLREKIAVQEQRKANTKLLSDVRKLDPDKLSERQITLLKSVLDESRPKKELTPGQS